MGAKVTPAQLYALKKADPRGCFLADHQITISTARALERKGLVRLHENPGTRFPPSIFLTEAGELVLSEAPNEKAP